jgi:hypothetical protein
MSDFRASTESDPNTRTQDEHRTLTANIRERRGSKVAINLPIFVDENTPQPFIDPTIPWDRNIYKEDPGEHTPLQLRAHSQFP